MDGQHDAEPTIGLFGSRPFLKMEIRGLGAHLPAELVIGPKRWLTAAARRRNPRVGGGLSS